jgi:DNA-binding transcriptional LysR family regulator
MVADKIRDGRLAPILEEFTPPPAPVNFVYSQSRLISPKPRAFVDIAAPRLRATLDSSLFPG